MLTSRTEKSCRLTYRQNLQKYTSKVYIQGFSCQSLTSAANRMKSALIKGLDMAVFVAKCATMHRVEKARNSHVRIWINGAA